MSVLKGMLTNEFKGENFMRTKQTLSLLGVVISQLFICSAVSAATGTTSVYIKNTLPSSSSCVVKVGDLVIASGASGAVSFDPNLVTGVMKNDSTSSKYGVTASKGSSISDTQGTIKLVVFYPTFDSKGNRTDNEKSFAQIKIVSVVKSGSTTKHEIKANVSSLHASALSSVIGVSGDGRSDGGVTVTIKAKSICN